MNQDNIKENPDLSKKGNAHLREALYMPAVAAITHNDNLKEFYDRLNEKFNYKKQSLVAVMRKLLVLNLHLMEERRGL
jgi:transposase